ncbi:PRC-barrel domain containing protein [Limibaculum sp. M0105]|uniref:PRC-barrel domain containing protein n=1 Tax=Thermohalobaculum xanthum TaxID=2753746 RepID=A0A8J7SI65_9RHOB|nr:PRC-barrel domain-containing protein [Thermohalobaculum xanthum]MBK0400145.1 PRC-barrel domain containing protein [Thermohalobaculum xanthum]
MDDIYFDDQDWVVRYLVAGLGFWIFGHQGLIGVELLGKPDIEQHELPVNLTADEIREAPRPQTHAPVSEQERIAQRSELSAWPTLMVGPPGRIYSPHIAQEEIRAALSRLPKGAGERKELGDPHLRSMEEIVGYNVSASDGDIGSVDDFLINPLDWRVRYYVIDTGNWLPGRRVVLATDWTTSIDWNERKVSVDVPRHKIESSPEIGEVSGLDRSREAELYRHYGAPFYWPI